MQTNHRADTVTVKIIANDRGNPPGKLADAELHFGADSPLVRLKLIGFAVWERRTGNGRNVTFPSWSLRTWRAASKRVAPDSNSSMRSRGDGRPPIGRGA